MPVRAKDAARANAASPALDSAVIDDVDVSDELSTSFLAYSMSVIVSRALPDVRDGLKPVHRRILWSMHEQGMRPDRGYSKCARAVGDTMGKYHPHGDSAIYDALVRMAQPWSLRLPLVDGHGNFGSLDDGPAASRYTEARLAPAAMSMVSELDEDTVDFRPNYDGREREPSVLPAAFPNLLVNGSTGIAVGMATSIPSHNLVEVVAGLQALLADPGLDLPALMRFIPGPDFPGGGIVHALDGMREAYRTGRGQFKVRARASVEEVSARRRGVVVTELPPGVGPERVIARVRELVQSRKLQGISDISDLSDRTTGLRLVVECKVGFSAEAVLEELYRLTPLEETFGANSVALVDGQPQTLGLLRMCSLFLDHRLDVVRRRSEFRLRKAEDRVHVLEGLLVALGAIDEVIALVRGSKDSASARARLVKRFSLSERQAEAILEMTIRRLTGLEVGRLKAEVKDLRALVADLRGLLASPVRMREVVSAELGEVSRQFGTPRRSTLMDGVPVVAAPLEVPDDPCAVVLAPSGGLLRAASASTVKGPRLGAVASTARGHVMVLTGSGMLLRVPVLEVPEPGKGKSRPLEVPGLPAGDAAVAVLPLSGVAAMATRLGMVKRVDLAALPVRDAQRVFSLRDGDLVLGGFVPPAEGASDACFVMVCSAGRLLRFPLDAVRPQGAAAGGVAGMRLEEGEHVVGFGLSVPGSLVACASDAGLVKWTPAEEYPLKGRAGAGMRCMSLRKAEQKVVSAVVAPAFVGLSDSGAVLRVSLPQARRDGPGADAGSPVRALLPA